MDIGKMQEMAAGALAGLEGRGEAGGGMARAVVNFEKTALKLRVEFARDSAAAERGALAAAAINAALEDINKRAAAMAEELVQRLPAALAGGGLATAAASAEIIERDFAGAGEAGAGMAVVRIANGRCESVELADDIAADGEMAQELIGAAFAAVAVKIGEQKAARHRAAAVDALRDAGGDFSKVLEQLLGGKK